MVSHKLGADLYSRSLAINDVIVERHPIVDRHLGSISICASTLENVSYWPPITSLFVPCSREISASSLTDGSLMTRRVIECRIGIWNRLSIPVQSSRRYKTESALGRRLPRREDLKVVASKESDEWRSPLPSPSQKKTFLQVDS